MTPKPTAAEQLREKAKEWAAKEAHHRPPGVAEKGYQAAYEAGWRARGEITHDLVRAVCREWNYHWLMEQPGYKDRVSRIDANMAHDLARRIVEALSPDT